MTAPLREFAELFDASQVISPLPDQVIEPDDDQMLESPDRLVRSKSSMARWLREFCVNRWCSVLLSREKSNSVPAAIVD